MKRLKKLRLSVEVKGRPTPQMFGTFMVMEAMLSMSIIILGQIFIWQIPFWLMFAIAFLISHFALRYFYLKTVENFMREINEANDKV